MGLFLFLLAVVVMILIWRQFGGMIKVLEHVKAELDNIRAKLGNGR